MRTTDRDCHAALIRFVHALREHRQEAAVLLQFPKSAVKPLKKLAYRLDVPLVGYGGQFDTFGLEHAPGCYGGGVRPTIFRYGTSAEYTPEWWTPSAGLGPGAVKHREFVLIVDAVASGLHLARALQEKK